MVNKIRELATLLNGLSYTNFFFSSLRILTVNTRQTAPLPTEQCDPLRTPFQKSLIGA